MTNLLRTFPILLLSGCQFGRVDQGQVVDYHPDEGRFTMIEDSNFNDPAHPKFDVLPAVAVAVPSDPAEIGPTPVSGKLLRLDKDARQLTVFDSSSQTIRHIPFTLIEERPAPRAPHGTFPKIDPKKKTITLYSPRDQMLITLSVADQYWNLPADTWRFGDEVRYYYKQPGRALRLMNVSQTDLARSK